MPSIEEQLAKLPLDDFSELVVRGAMRVIADAENPIRLNLFAAAIRELFGHTLDRLAPDGEVVACGWFEFEEDQKKPTRRQRAKYATQGGLPDEFIRQAGIDVEHLHDAAIKAVNTLSKYTHVREGVIVQDPEEIEAFVGSALGALVGLFESFTSCRSQIEEAVYEKVNDESVSALLYETIQSLDELSTHHCIDEIYVDNVEITCVNASTIHFEVSGSIAVQLQWGSSSDIRRDDGAIVYKSFPFCVTMWSPVENITAFEETNYVVDTRDWWDGYYDEDDIRYPDDTETAATESDPPF